MAKPRKHPEASKTARAGVKPGETPNTDASRRPGRPVDEEDVFGGAERTKKTKNVKSGSAKP
ncbi:MAG: hypothetical protein KJZ75_01790 [Hyphomonadaceae bacterium]|nr:hypothetical protein [Hyphomonadaceae bacterium]GIK50006.1 MAG: hypothetical protein BroJett013_27030 [Alphaproteobacteria bacterium]